MSRNALLTVIGALAICAIVIGYLYYQERQSGVQIRIDETGLTIDGD
jgi:hypothetical protein